MSQTVIKIKGLSKRYRLGIISSGSFISDLNSAFFRLLGYTDPNKKVNLYGDENKKNKLALSNINLKITKGEILGIIGSNGAGKSTLLKIISRITSPSSGTVKIRGKVASLLEIGTGFHPELTGRENIYLNGSIMGMTKKEINLKINQIINFSGIGNYIDTPVKRYSSGMGVRLGFSIAAHLEPDILLVDEVLAVGDAEFQKKCLGKMESVSRLGRTVIFISHNMDAIQALCSRAILMKNGQIIYDSIPKKTILHYLKNDDSINFFKSSDKNKLNLKGLKFLTAKVKPSKGNIINVHSGFKIEIKCFCSLENASVDITLELYTNNQIKLLHTGNLISNRSKLIPGEYKFEAHFPKNILNCGIYKLKIWSGLSGIEKIASIDKFIKFEIHEGGVTKNIKQFPGILKPNIVFKTDRICNQNSNISPKQFKI